MSVEHPTVVLHSHGDEILVLLGVVVLVGAGLVPAFVRLERRLGPDGTDPVALAGAPGVDHDPEAGTATLPDGTTLDRGEAAAVGAAYDYFERRPAATREELQRECFADHPAGFDDPEEWWRELVDPAVTALAEANLADGDTDPDGVDPGDPGRDDAGPDSADPDDAASDETAGDAGPDDGDRGHAGSSMGEG